MLSQLFEHETTGLPGLRNDRVLPEVVRLNLESFDNPAFKPVKISQPDHATADPDKSVTLHADQFP